jgi:hypothetical protein
LPVFGCNHDDRIADEFPGNSSQPESFNKIRWSGMTILAGGDKARRLISRFLTRLRQTQPLILTLR